MSDMEFWMHYEFEEANNTQEEMQEKVNKGEMTEEKTNAGEEKKSSSALKKTEPEMSEGENTTAATCEKPPKLTKFTLLLSRPLLRSDITV